LSVSPVPAFVPLTVHAMLRTSPASGSVDVAPLNAGTGETLNYNFAQDGSYTVRLIVSDNLGAADTVSTTVNVSNVAPGISALPVATLFPGETYTASGSFSDPGADAWTATVNYGDGAGAQTLLLSGKTFALSHRYLARGSFTLAVSVSDDDVTSTRTQLVTVLTESQGLDQVAAAIANLVGSGKLSSKDARKLLDNVDDARKDLARGRTGRAEDELEKLRDDIDDLVRSRRLSPSDAAPFRSILGRVIHSLSLLDDDDHRGRGRHDNDKHDDKHDNDRR
jgi:hypothetical protein